MNRAERGCGGKKRPTSTSRADFVNAAAVGATLAGEGHDIIADGYYGLDVSRLALGAFSCRE